MEERIACTCKICGKNSANIQSHMLIHSGEKPHECVVCGHKFRTKHNLNCHLETHNAEKKQSKPQTTHAQCSFRTDKNDRNSLSLKVNRTDYNRCY